MKGFEGDLKEIAKENELFRKVLFTSARGQLVVMNLQPGEEIGEEVHDADQFIYVVKGEAEVVLNGDSIGFEKGAAAYIPEGTRHNVINRGDEPVKLFTIYSPPQHPDGFVEAAPPAKETVLAT